MGGACSPSWRKRNACSVLVGKPEGKRPLGTLNVDVRILLIWIFEQWVERTLSGLILLRLGTDDGLF
jgi:hypothetical protein